MIPMTSIATAVVLGLHGAGEGSIRDITWEFGPNLPEFRKGGCAAALDGKVVSVFGMRYPWAETSTLYVYDPETNWWTPGPDGPVGQCYVQGTECNGTFYAIGGRHNGVSVECYRLDARNDSYTWTQAPGLNDARGWAPSVSVDGELFVFGGAKSGRGPTLNSVEMLDTTAPDGKWEVVGRIPGDSRGWLGAAAVRGCIYVFGGGHFFDPKPDEGPDRKKLAETIRFDPDSFAWEPVAPLPYRLSGMDSCVYQDRYIIVVGGAPEIDDFTPEMKEAYEKSERFESYYCPFVLVYDVETDTWTVLPTLMPTPTNDIRVVLLGNKLYALGGENVEPATSNTTAWLRIGTIVE